MADIDTAGFRHWYDSGRRTGREISPPQVIRDVFDLCDEIDRLRREWDTLVNERADLRARLAEVEAERDGFDSDFRDLIAAHSAAEKECTDLRARLVEVETRLRAASVLEIDFKVRDRIIAAARGEGGRPAEPCRHDGSNGTCAECRLAHPFGEGDRLDASIRYIADRDAELLRRRGEGDR